MYMGVYCPYRTVTLGALYRSQSECKAELSAVPSFYDVKGKNLLIQNRWNVCIYRATFVQAIVEYP
jgi:hypothetical protein